ncbi:glutamate synthase-related protein [Streptomyces sp. NPDC060011]|uniref:glutamate synthase-related protein n=1 Tax=unclassified Streptomyces TaxID=2593676 RepID=UPI0013BE3B83|nr:MULTISPECIES: glutamate synthase-related protein [unclassified Streptomyces]MCX5134087.1 glutamate synthase-related protein [Streptomyces sp. NBC_00340]MCX5281767.1 glutamate synthase-related protein [Streptomyces sp. NBC_00198]NEB33437.1 glutamate synthase [Streptomyces sp. SID14446]WSD75065.1 glutamate synthase-related protein [Streptomyces sp. NBC_01558]
MTYLTAPGLPEDAIRARARDGAAAVFPPADSYGTAVFGGTREPGDEIDALRLAPPVFMPGRLAKLIDLGREPLYSDVRLTTALGGFDAPVPVYVSALGSTRVAGTSLALSRQAGRLGIPMVIGENVAPMNGFRSSGDDHRKGLLERILAYCEELPDGVGGVCVQQSTEDADSEVWNQVYSDPAVSGLLTTGRLGFEMKVGQGAKPGLGGLTMISEAAAADLDGQYAVERLAPDGGAVLRCSSPGTFTDEIFRRQIQLMRNNYPRARCWVKLFPGRDVGRAAAIAWEAGAHAVTVDGAEGGTGWAPTGFLGHVGLPLAECLRRVDPADHTLLASGRVWDGIRAVKLLALGARAVGLGRAALVAADEDPDHGLERLLDAMALEMRMAVSSLGRYAADETGPEDLWRPES